ASPMERRQLGRGDRARPQLGDADDRGAPAPNGPCPSLRSLGRALQADLRGCTEGAPGRTRRENRPDPALDRPRPGRLVTWLGYSADDRRSEVQTDGVLRRAPGAPRDRG